MTDGLEFELEQAKEVVRDAINTHDGVSGRRSDLTLDGMRHLIGILESLVGERGDVEVEVAPVVDSKIKQDPLVNAIYVMTLAKGYLIARDESSYGSSGEVVSQLGDAIERLSEQWLETGETRS